MLGSDEPVGLGSEITGFGSSVILAGSGAGGSARAGAKDDSTGLGAEPTGGSVPMGAGAAAGADGCVVGGRLGRSTGTAGRGAMKT